MVRSCAGERCFAALLLCLLWLPGLARAEIVEGDVEAQATGPDLTGMSDCGGGPYIRRETRPLGFSPDGRPVFLVLYEGETFGSPSFSKVIAVLRLDGESTLPKALDAFGPNCELVFIEGDPPSSVFADNGENIHVSRPTGRSRHRAFLSPDGLRLHLNSDWWDHNNGNTFITRLEFVWNTVEKKYDRRTVLATSMLDEARDDLQRGMVRAERREVLAALGRMHELSGRYGYAAQGAPDDLLPLLWHFFRYEAAGEKPEDGRTILREFIAAAVWADGDFGGAWPISDAAASLVCRSLKSAPETRTDIAECARMLAAGNEPEPAETMRRLLEISAPKALEEACPHGGRLLP